MRKLAHSPLWILLTTLLIVPALADPPIGEPPFHKYPFVYDPYFDVPDNSYFALGPGQPNPPRGTVYPDGN